MRRAALLLGLVLMTTGCSSIDTAIPMRKIIMGDNVCGREGTQIYFANQDDQLSTMAAQVVSELSNKLARCTGRKVILIAVSGNDGAPATTLVAANRIKTVGDLLISQGLGPERVITAIDGPYVSAIQPGPIGGIVVMTKR
jgi:sulfur carrier protein ThiS